jgi:integral membrane protein (TIGR00529 family)
MWQLIILIIAFIVLFILVIKEINIGLALIISSIILGITTLTLMKFIQISIDTLINYLTIELILTMVFITVFSYMYQETGIVKELTESLEKIISNEKSIMMIIPAIFGLLPVLGGALFSAPIIENEGEKMKMEKGVQAFINLWFRHLLFLIYPLEQAYIIVVYLTGIDLKILIAYQIPTFIMAIFSGYIFGLRKYKSKKYKKSFNEYWIKKFLIVFFPILLAIILSLIGLKIYISIMIGIIFLILMSKNGIKILINVMKRKEVLGMALTAFGIMFFREILDKSNILNLLSIYIQTYNVSKIFLFMIIPFLIGFCLGVPTAAIAIIISILSKIINFNPLNLSIIFTSMYLGHIISPVHLCVAVTCQYFKVNILEVYKKMILAEIITFIIPILIFLIT